MKKSKPIEHEGVIKAINPQFIDVEIINKSMCSACHAKSACTMSDQSAKLIRVNNFYGAKFEEGENVLVVMKRTMGLRAVWISYAIPLIILLILLLSLPYLNLNELQSALIAVLGVAVYYFGIYLFRDKIAEEFTFTIEKHNKH